MNRYSALDKLLHRIAFSNINVQLWIESIEDSLFGKEYADISIDRPIFITSLPRAGTTILLKALSGVPCLATHLYRDMPFVMAPILWSRVGAAFQRRGNAIERAHGDGIKIDYDSPEAFEEVIWQTFWPEHYEDDVIRVWKANESKADGIEFLLRHFKKIIALRSGENTRSCRYISKNNNNIARIELIHSTLPQGKILVLVREPISHAQSLLKQHRNFSRLHAEDPFVFQYMKDIGHLEFGELHRPIAFDGFDPVASNLKSSDFDYWLAYWIAAFDCVRKHREKVAIVSYERLSERDIEYLSSVCNFIGIQGHANVDRISENFRPANIVPAPPEASVSLVARARELHEGLLA